MQPIAHALTPAERDAAAAAFAAMPAPAPHPVAAGADPLGARRGRWALGLMAHVAGKLTPAEIAAVAAYFGDESAAAEKTP